MPRHLDVRTGSYHDSVTLMQVSRSVAAEPGVVAAMVAMATELNLDLLDGMGFQRPAGAGPNDLVVAVETADDDALPGALCALDTALAGHRRPGPSGDAATAPPRTVTAAARDGDATVAFVSTPGAHAFVEAMDAVEHELPVIVFSDNVPVEQEVRLKRAAAARGVLVMGPDCGTAVVGGTGFGFANVVRPGPVGIVAASGTGAQHVMSLLDAVDVGVSHCLGVGGRDMSAEVGGASTLAALDLLADDDATEVVVVLGKPPAPAVADLVHTRAESAGKPVVVAPLGAGGPDLTAVAESVAETVGAPWRAPRSWPAPTPRSRPHGHVNGIFSGGTLCDEAMLIASAALGPVRSNTPLRADWALPEGAPPWGRPGDGHVMIDFGDDALTRGRAHPMIDNTLRIERLLAAADDPACGVVLLDVVLGHGAHPDPAGELAPAISEAREHAGAQERDLAVVVSLVGTADDPQGLTRQATTLRDAGASVHLSNAEATRTAVELVEARR
ncbi:FdrA protein [Haloactinopolyspora alba]|uniref:FdrA protein n=1 Tax=Haloactinopolyspora alba TaxID=648780 RepID=A0A2P8E3H6_9ACTN|nr:FdrA family protein [Haloactinopolyspora alba]PSL04014.1 FdrA protein [Haloactinopolyspora alba]